MTRICNVLVVEDDDSVRALLGDVLDHAGYEFTLARDGAEMRAALDAEVFDVAIIDISLRGGEDGFALAEVASGKGCGVILTTGDPERRVRLEASGRRYLMKPFRMKQLTDLVDEILRDDAALCMRRPPTGSTLSASE
jgi:two-component system phosphate regulon response regulator OmpR